MATKYPHIRVRLSGSDGNAFAIVALVRRALKKAGVPEAEIEEFSKEATSGDYDNVLVTAMKTVEVL